MISLDHSFRNTKSSKHNQPWSPLLHTLVQKEYNASCHVRSLSSSSQSPHPACLTQAKSHLQQCQRDLKEITKLSKNHRLSHLTTIHESQSSASHNFAHTMLQLESTKYSFKIRQATGRAITGGAQYVLDPSTNPPTRISNAQTLHEFLLNRNQDHFNQSERSPAGESQPFGRLFLNHNLQHQSKKRILSGSIPDISLSTIEHTLLTELQSKVAHIPLSDRLHLSGPISPSEF